MKFSEKLIKLRKENKLSQEQLADMLDVSRQAVSKWESGQTYPEMDKLLALCKIFKCTLDELTNDDISKDDIIYTDKKKNTFVSAIYEMLEFINNSITTFKKMKFKEIVKMVIELLCLFGILLLLKIPFNWVIDIFGDLLRHFASRLSFYNGLTLIWSGLINVIYVVLAVIIFIYVFKSQYIDKYEQRIVIDESEDDSNNREELKSNAAVKEKVIIKRKEFSSNIFNLLTTIVLWIIKFIALFFGVFLVLSLIFISFLFILDFVLLFRGVFFLGIFLGLIVALVFNTLLVEVLFRFIFNMHINFKRVLITFIASFIGIGASLGIIMVEFTTIKYVENPPIFGQVVVQEEEFAMRDGIFIRTNWGTITTGFVADTNFHIDDWSFNFVKDEKMTNSFKIKLEYNKECAHMYLEEDETLGTIDITQNTDYSFNDILNILNTTIDGLSKREYYDWDKLDVNKVTITTSEENWKKLMTNADKYYEKMWDSQNYEREKELEEQNDEYLNQISDLEEENQNLVNEKEELKEKITELEDKIEDYKSRIADLLE